MYEVILSDEADKQLKKLEKDARIRIINSLKKIRIRPYSFIKKLVGNPYFSLRVGNYRVILRIDENKVIILVVEIGHRKNIYKK